MRTETDGEDGRKAGQQIGAGDKVTYVATIDCIREGRARSHLL